MNCFCFCFLNRRRDNYQHLSSKVKSTSNIYSELPRPIVRTPLTHTRFYRTTCGHQANNLDELSFIAGDILEVETSSTQHMCRAKHLKSSVIRLVAKDHLEPESIYQMHKWYFKDISRIETERILFSSGNRRGSFLVREAPVGPNPFVLSVRCENYNFKSIVKHYRIFKGRPGYYISNGLYFDSLETLVDAYRRDVYGIMGLYQNLNAPCVRGVIMETML